jgi:2-haloacid dehalogenase
MTDRMSSTTTTPDGSPSGVVWDLGNVLIDWQPAAAIAAAVGEDEAARFLAATDFDFMAWNHVQDSGGRWDQAVAEVARSHPHWAEHAAAYPVHFARSLVGEVAGTVDVLRTLHGAGVPQWGLTNWSDELYPHAPAMFDFLGLLDGVVVSGTEGVAKPDPRVFAIVSERAGLPFDRLVFVDDRADNVAAAVTLGMDGIVFTDAEALRAALRERGLPA